MIENNNFLVALYIRLSREDEEKETVSESVINQKSLLLQYVKENNYSVYDIYIDDGFSGTNFNRPEFKRMIKDIENKNINMVITKDMSRLGRDYIETGNLIEKYFPKHNVRYIAIDDNIDTYFNSSNNDIAPFKAIMNDMYAKDISKKIRSSLKAKMKEGKFVGARSPFGYMKDPIDKNHLIINNEQALIVKRIFKMSQDGLSFFKIAKKLTEENIKSPASYYNFKWRNNLNTNYNIWHSKTIKDILSNRIYIGDMVQNRRNKVNYKIKKIVSNNISNYIIVENTHEAIIDKKTFYEVQTRIPKNVGRCEKKEKHLLDGLLYCYECGNRISVTPRRKKDNKCYTICNYYRTYIKEKVCTTHSNNYDLLEEEVIDFLKEKVLNNINKSKIKEVILNNLKMENDLSDKKEFVKNKIKNINNNLDEVYIDKLNNNISEEQFERIKKRLEEELIVRKKEYENIVNISKNDNKDKNKLINDYIDNFLSLKNISRELLLNLIDKIIIHDNKSIDIILVTNKI